MTSTLRSSRRIRPNMRARCMIAIQMLLICNSVVFSLVNPNEKDDNNNRILRQRIDGNGDMTDENNNPDNTARQYLETLWDSVEKKRERKLEDGRMPYLESMMGMLTMSMSMPNKPPSRQSPTSTPGTPTKSPTTPGTPTKFPISKEPTPTRMPSSSTALPTQTEPTRKPVSGPTLPTRVPIPTRGPNDAPSLSVPTLSNPPTPAPFSPTQLCKETEAERELLLLETLSSTTDRWVFLDKNTPQGMAHSFLLKEKLSFVCTPTLMQRYGLSVLYFATGGTDWTDATGWLGSEHECNWYGVECNKDLFVTSLNLAINNVNGIIPDEISALSTLQKFDLFSNTITGTLPAGLSGLTNLVTLDLQRNFLVGDAFPNTITSLDRLVSYRISDNQLTGKIPNRIGLLRKLSELWAGNNLISGSIPSNIGDLRNLKTIYVNNNALTGKVPSELGLIPLQALVMNDNSFFDTIPSQLFNVASLSTIRLDGNFFVGTLPDAIGQLTDLENFRVEKNNLSGRIPESIGSMTSLINLRLSDNFWTGTIPDVFYNYRQLDYFDVSNTVLGGTIPISIFSIPTLRLAYMSNCNLQGTIPVQFSEASELRDLYLDGNDLTGVIPPIAPGQLTKLNEFLLQTNRIYGAMPESICRLRSESVLDDLWTDCGGPSPEIECNFPECCNRCFEAGTASSTRRNGRQLLGEK
mmetsp:Transcript_20118/g.42554  ORF Transcript_20118/g.42554 Transcript_20118/m.42554 type:complete len:693 (-) Transcript_20118:111-2189(-)